ncbi:MAG: TAT-variant-translocated molybdopterin oxidoreductase [Terriglobales bacterium]
MGSETKYWKSLQERDGDPGFLRAAGDEFTGELPIPALQATRRGLANFITRILPAAEARNGQPALKGSRPPTIEHRPSTASSRRDFLKAAGFTFAVAGAVGCNRAPLQKAIPLLNQPEEIVPGDSFYYASTCGGCTAGCGVIAKVRDGRPVKLEGNPQHALSRGGLCAAGQASILGLYDSQRFKAPLKSGKESDWTTVDRDIVEQLAAIRSQRGKVLFLTGTINSPTIKASVDTFLASFPGARQVAYDPLSHSAILDAHRQTHGARVLPAYRFDRAEVVVSFDADFLATWISPVQFTTGYRAARDLEASPPRSSYHLQLEPRMSLTGSKADRRVAIAPSQAGALLTALAARIAKRAGVRFAEGQSAGQHLDAVLDDAAARLWAARGKSLVVSGSNDVAEQLLVNFINHLLGNYGHTLDVERPSYQAQGSDAELESLLQELDRGEVRALFISGVNPAFDLPGNIAKAIKKVPLVVSFAERPDETAALAHYVCPDRNYLESWADAEPVAGYISVTQPVIRPLGKTRQLIESLAAWCSSPRPAYELIRDSWQSHVYSRRLKQASFDEFWDAAVHDGSVEVTPAKAIAGKFNVAAVQPIAAEPSGENFEAVLYPTAAMYDGRHAYNPWLHELPDPINKVTWGNCVSLSPATAQKLGIVEGDVVHVATDGAPPLELPAYVQPGQHDAVIAIALGHGSRLSARFANVGPQWIEGRSTVGADGLVGTNAAPALTLTRGSLRYTRAASISRTGRRDDLATTQTHHSLAVPVKLAPPDGGMRQIVQETTLAAFLKDPHSGVEDHEEKEDLWPADHSYTGIRWGMVVDLAACTGCSACVIACQAENNIPVVGKDEIRRNREMHWLRVDRYYSDLPNGEVATAYQPMMCQQCENAPCETVCPVLATVHSEDGLNSQVYNRCVGTRYCANNCPYKGRRFNWFNYFREDHLQNLVLNPDVTVRSRGVMEKCTFCVQRLQEAKIDAKRRGTQVADGNAQTACQQSCSAKAIYFGNLNDPASKVTRMMKNPRRYRVLSETNVKPAVGYLTVVRNTNGDTEDKHNG